MNMMLGSLISKAPQTRCGDGNYPVLSMTMHDGIVLQQDRFSKVIASRDTANYKIVKRGQLVVGFPINEGVIYPQTIVDAGIMSPAYNVWDIDQTAVDIRYLNYCLHSPASMKYYADKLRGSTARRKSLPTPQLLALPIYLPPLDIQRHIAVVLDKAQALIAARREQIAVLDKLSKDLFVDMFGDPMLNPMKWESAILGDVCKVRSSKRIYQREQTREGVPFLRVSDIVSRITWQGETASLFISDALYDELDKSGLTPKPNDILVTSRGTLGRCYIVKDGDRFYFQDGMISWLDNSNQNINVDYLVQVFQSEKVIKQITEKSAGSTVAYLSLGNLQAVEIPCPPLSLQDEFSGKIGLINKQKARIIQSLAELESLYKALTQRAFSGELFT